MMRPVLLIVALGLAAAAGFCQKPKTPEQLIVGKWQEKGADGYFEFKADQTVGVGGKALGLKVEGTGTYSFIAADRVKIEFNGVAALAGPQTYAVAFPDENSMTMKNESNGKIKTYLRTLQ